MTYGFWNGLSGNLDAFSVEEASTSKANRAMSYQINDLKADKRNQSKLVFDGMNIA